MLVLLVAILLAVFADSLWQVAAMIGLAVFVSWCLRSAVRDKVGAGHAG